LARRGLRREGWENFGYDGLGRLLWSQSPDGDRRELFYENDWVCVETQAFRHTGPRDKSGQADCVLHTVTLRDDRGQPWCTVPVGRDGTVGIGRAVLVHYSSEGNPAFELQPESTKTLRFYNTLGLVEREVVRASDSNGKLFSQTDTQYDPDGLLARREVHNQPLVFVPQVDAAAPVKDEQVRVRPLVNIERQKVAQVRKLQYDGFRRLVRETAPDGLVQEYAYGEDSRVTSLARYQLAEKEHKEVLNFEYDRLGRVTKVQNGTVQRDPQTLQELAYDWQDHIIQAWDYGQPEHPVEVKRWYDNFGQLLQEQIRLPKDRFEGPALVYEYDMLQGKHSAKLDGLDGQPAGWRRLEVQQDLTGRVRRIAKDARDFCRLEYLGSQEVEKRFEEPAIVETVCPDPFLEPEKQSLVEEKTSGSPLYEMHYLRDGRGRVVASSIRVPTKNWECSKFYDRDFAGNLIADDTQARFLGPTDLARESTMRLKGPDRPGGAVPIGVHHVRRYAYDEAGNNIAWFRGPATGRWPQGAELASSWDPRASPQPVAGLQPPQIRPVSFAPADTAAAQSPATSGSRASAAAARQWALASNRTACKAQVVQDLPCQARLAAHYEYDRFGRLTSYHSSATGQRLRWEIEYDVLGRVVGMKGFDSQPQQPQPREEHNQAKPESKQPQYELRLAYDPFNRRIVKYVQKNGGTTHDGNPTVPDITVHAMLYTSQRPAVKLCKPTDPTKPWTIEGQYIWGAGPSKVLAYYERASLRSAAAQDEPVVREYLLHQDAALNVVLSTRRLLGKTEVCDVASYWGLGENSTTGVVQAVDSSLKVEKGREAKWAIDRVLDENSATWISNDDRGFLSLKLAQRHRLSHADVWADKLPEQFRTYVVAEGQGPTRENPLTQWEKQHEQDRVSGARDPSTDVKTQAASAQEPRELWLDGHEGQEIVLVWDRCPGGIAVREFEVFVEPLHPGDLAFSGTIYDAETGLYYHGARYRLPELGTFISPDPLGFLGGDNLYAFAHNDPLTWHDPEGRFAHILLGAGAGAALGAGSYVFQWWWYGEEWSWARLGIYAGAGTAGGAAAAAIGPAALAFTASHGASATTSAVVAETASRALDGAVRGAIQAGGTTFMDTRDLGASLSAASSHALSEGLLGAFAGSVGERVAASLRGSLLGFVASGASGGAAVGFVTTGYEAYRSEATLNAVLRGAFCGAVRGLAGGIIDGAAWGVSRATGQIRPLLEQPRGLPDPRSKGLLIRTEPTRGDYGGASKKSGYARHHVKPLSLGGTDSPDNIIDVSIDVHQQPHPGHAVTSAPHGTIFY
jgi:RHS repeat-associated protein